MTEQATRFDPPYVRVLGPCSVSGAEREPSPIQRRVLARLAAAAGQPVAVGVLAEAVWADEVPRTAKAALLNQVSRLRSAFGDDLVVTTPDGYALGVTTDLELVAEAVRLGERAVAEGDHQLADDLLTVALDRWTGRPFTDIDHVGEAESVRQRAAELRHAAENLRLAAALRLGRVAFAVPEAERLVSHSPYDEQRWVFLAQALERAGRRGDALAVFDRARRSLRDGLGLDPGPVLRAAEATSFGIDASAPGSASRQVVGRDDLLADLEERALEGESVVVDGEAGVGVSTVLAELARRLRGRTSVAHTACALSPSTPLSVLTDLLEQLSADPPGVMAAIERFVSVVRRLAAGGGVVLVIDDLHHAGPSTLDALATVASIDGVSLVVAAREAVALLDAEPGRWHRNTVAPLDRTAVGTLATALSRPGVAGPDRLEWLVGMSGGNPLLLESLLEPGAPAAPGRGPTRDDVLGTVPDDSGVAAVPDGVAQLVRARLDRLDVVTRSTIDLAAVAGPEFSVDVLDALASEPGAAAAYADGLLVRMPGERVRFRHGAVQRVVYADLAPGRRTELHHAVGEVLAGRDHPSPVVARHLLAAAEIAPVEAVTVGRRAAAAATRAGAHRDAADWLRRSADAARSLGPAGARAEVECLVELGDALRLAGDPAHGEVLADAFERAVELGDAELVASAAFASLALGFTTGAGAAHEVAVTVADRALSIVTSADDRARVAAAASLGLSMTGEADRCRELFLAALDQTTEASTRRQVLPFAYMSMGLPDDLDRRTAAGEELLALGRAADDPVAVFEALHLSFSVALQVGDGVAARRHLDEMVGMVDAVGDVGRRWAVLYQMAAVAHLDDDLERSERLAEDALATFVAVSPSRALAAHGGQLLAIRLAQGRLGEMAGTFEFMVAEQPEVPAWHAALALALVDDDAPRAAVHARAALDDVPADFLWLAAHVIGGRAAASVGDDETVGRYLQRLTSWSGRSCWQGTCTYGPVDTVVALLHRRLGDERAASDHARRAIALVQRLGAPVFGRELVELGLVPS